MVNRSKHRKLNYSRNRRYRSMKGGSSFLKSVRSILASTETKAKKICEKEHQLRFNVRLIEPKIKKIAEMCVQMKRKGMSQEEIHKYISVKYLQPYLTIFNVSRFRPSFHTLFLLSNTPDVSGMPKELITKDLIFMRDYYQKQSYEQIMGNQHLVLFVGLENFKLLKESKKNPMSNFTQNVLGHLSGTIPTPKTDKLCKKLTISYNSAEPVSTQIINQLLPKIREDINDVEARRIGNEMPSALNTEPYLFTRLAELKTFVKTELPGFERSSVTGMKRRFRSQRRGKGRRNRMTKA